VFRLNTFESIRFTGGQWYNTRVWHAQQGPKVGYIIMSFILAYRWYLYNVRNCAQREMWHKKFSMSIKYKLSFLTRNINIHICTLVPSPDYEMSNFENSCQNLCFWVVCFIILRRSFREQLVPISDVTNSKRPLRLLIAFPFCLQAIFVLVPILKLLLSIISLQKALNPYWVATQRYSSSIWSNWRRKAIRRRIVFW